jgi:hypothetical protein
LEIDQGLLIGTASEVVIEVARQARIRGRHFRIEHLHTGQKAVLREARLGEGLESL